MKISRELYKKELRQHRQEYGVLFLFTALSMITVVFNNPQVFWKTLAQFSWKYAKVGTSFDLFQDFNAMVLLLFVPALLLYSLYDERKTRSVAQNLFLPVPRYALLFHKCLGVLSMAFLLDFMLAMTRQYFATKSILGAPGETVEMFLEQFSILGIVTAAIGTAQIPKRNRVLFGFTVAFIILYAFHKYNPKIAQFLNFKIQHAFISYDPALLLNLNHVVYYCQFLCHVLCTTFFAGILYAVGFTLYHKLAEV